MTYGHKRIDQGDKAEAAWTWTLLDWDGNNKWSSSKSQVVSLTGCSEGVVAHMRRVVRWHHEQATGQVQTPMGETLCKALGHDLSMHSWNRVKEEAVGFTPKQRDANEAAAALARNLDNRMPILRTTDPEVTAQALWLYDRDMCSALADALQRRVEKEAKGEQDLDDQAAYEALEATEVP